MADQEQDAMKRDLPSQAEGEEETVDAALNKEKSETEKTPPRKKPSQAEGSRDLAEEELDENRLE